MADLRIGTSGWSYRHWRGQFYPEGLRVADQLDYYASKFDTAEINGSFYRLPSEAAVEAWRDATPDGFVFAWKASRFITHLKRLKDVEDSIELVFGRMGGLGPTLGPALFQLPPNLKPDLERLEAFLKLLPKSPRSTIEFRHPAWYDASTWDLLTRYRVALCISDHHDAPAPWKTTTDFVYVRGHGPTGRYVGAYPQAELEAWAGRIKGWRRHGFDVYAYFDNDIGGHAPRDAERLKELTGARSASRPRSAQRSRRSA